MHTLVLLDIKPPKYMTANEGMKILLELEKKILRLLQIDSLTDSSTWYLDNCANRYFEQNGGSFVLLLTDFALDYSPADKSVQVSLDFAEAREKELFKGREMGEDVHMAIEKYQALEAKILDTIERELAVAEKASAWAMNVLKSRKQAQ